MSEPRLDVEDEETPDTAHEEHWEIGSTSHMLDDPTSLNGTGSCAKSENQQGLD